MNVHHRLARLRRAGLLRERRLERETALLATAQVRLAEARDTSRRSHEAVRQGERAIAALSEALTSGMIAAALFETGLARIDQLRDRLARAEEALAGDRLAEAAAEQAAEAAARAWARARARLEAVSRWRLKEQLALAAASERLAEQSDETGRGAPWS